VRSTAEKWSRGSVLAVDAGTHLAGICHILEPYVLNSLSKAQLPPITINDGPFAGLELPFQSLEANAAHVTRYLVDTYMITHPHLDHISGFVVNTAGLPGVRPKRLAGLPSTIKAFKDHIFNDVIWPNLSDENHGVGLVTYMRLVDGGSPALGDGDGKGYVEVCGGLTAKALSVSHGHCMENHGHRGSVRHSHGSLLGELDPTIRSRSGSLASLHQHPKSPELNRADPTTNTTSRICVVDSSAYFIRDIHTGREVLIFGDVEPDSISLSPRNLRVWLDAAPKIASGLLTAIFIECSYTDAQSEDQLYGHLAPRFLHEELRMLAQCVTQARKDIAEEKEACEFDKEHPKKRKRTESGKPQRRSPRISQITSVPSTPPQNLGLGVRGTGAGLSVGTVPRIRRSFDLDGAASGASPDSPVSPHTLPQSLPRDRPSHSRTSDAPFGHLPKPTSAPIALPSGDVPTSREDVTMESPPGEIEGALKGLKVVIIHVKDRLSDGEAAGETILREVGAYESEEPTGVEYEVAVRGGSVFV
jgi:cAMP phosphodiesterase